MAKILVCLISQLLFKDCIIVEMAPLTPPPGQIEPLGLDLLQKFKAKYLELFA
jgi:hypothetical protein